jgi:hypothetical protein
MIKVAEDSSGAWSSFKLSAVNAIVVDGADVLIVRIRESIEVLARAQRPEVSVALGTRAIARTEFTQVTMKLRLSGLDVSLGMLPSDVKQFAVPSFESLGDLVGAIRAQLDKGGTAESTVSR